MINTAHNGSIIAVYGGQQLITGTIVLSIVGSQYNRQSYLVRLDKPITYQHKLFSHVVVVDDEIVHCSDSIGDTHRAQTSNYR